MNLITGSILDITTGTVLHQVNAIGTTGGLAGALRRKWPSAFIPYFDACAKGGCQGLFCPGRATPSLWIGHVFGQLHPGPNTDMRWVREALQRAGEFMPDKPIYAPWHMGCGLGGGNWAEYLAALVHAFPNIIIVQREGDK